MIDISCSAERQLQAAELPSSCARRAACARRLDIGEEVALILPRGEVLRGGDRCAATDGRVVEVVAAPEKLLHIECAPTLARVAYHLGNRHVPVQVGDGLPAHRRGPRARGDGCAGSARASRASRRRSSPRPAPTAASTMPRRRDPWPHGMSTQNQGQTTFSRMRPEMSLRACRACCSSPAPLPVGAYSYSQGLEAAVEAGIVTDAASAEAWIADVLEFSRGAHGSAGAAWRRSTARDARSAERLLRRQPRDRRAARRDAADGAVAGEAAGMSSSVRSVPLEEPAYPTAFALRGARTGASIAREALRRLSVVAGWRTR